MKKLLIGLLVFIVVALAGVKIVDYVVIGGEEYYVQIMTDGTETVSKVDSGQETINYRYILSGYTKEGKEKGLDFNGQLTRPLRKGAYSRITWNGKGGITSYEEVEKKDVPKTTLEKLIKGWGKEEMNKIVEVQNITKVYGKNSEEKTRALNGISFDVEKGEFIGIMGASGSGKSTFLNILPTLDKPTNGHIRANQKDVTTLKRNRLADFRTNGIGFISQNFNLLESLIAQEDIAVPLSLQGVRPKEIKQHVQKITECLSIVHILKNYPSEISSEQRQRVAATRMLITQPTILLGDEPTGALNSKSAHDPLDTMDKLDTENRISILLVTYDLFSASHCRHILFVKDSDIHQEMKRGDQSQDSFYREMLSILGNLEQ